MSAGRAKVVVDVEANVNQINNAIKSVQSNLSKLNLPPAAEKSFNKLFSNLEAEITNFRAKASSAISSPAELKAFTGSWNKILELYRKLGIEVKNLGALNPKQLQNLVPSDLATKMSKVTVAMDVFSQKTKQINSEAGKVKGQITKATNSLEGFKKQLTSLESKKVLPDDDFEKLANDARKAANELAAANQELAKAQAAFDTAPRTKTGKVDRRTKAGRDASDNLAAAEARVDTASTNKAKFDGWQDRYVKASSKDTEIAKLKQNISDTQTRIEKLKVTLNSLTETDATKVFQELKTKIGEITGVDVSAAQSVDDLKESLSELTQQSANQAQSAIDALDKELSQLEPNIQSTSKEVDNTTQSFRKMVDEANNIEQLKSRLVAFFSIGGVVQTFRRAIQTAYESVRELDEAMTATAVVTDFSVGDMWEQLPQYTEMASKLGATLKGAYETMTLFYQQGLDTNQATQLGTETMKMARIAGLDYATATDYMTAALRGFNLELNQLSAQRVNDIYSKLAAVTASDTEEISIAMTKTASIADSANMSLETTAALLSQIIETTREAPETAGTALKTIIARFQELKKNPAEISEVDGEAIDANKIEGALRSIGVALRDSSGQFRSLDDVFLDISKKWDSLSTNQQRYIATMAAGSRQQSRFIAMMQDYSRTMELVSAANNSAGAAEEQFEKTTTSLQAKVNKLKTAWQTFTMGLANNTLIKGVVDGLRIFLNLLNRITDVLGANGLGDFAITLTLVITLLSKAKSTIDGLLRGAKDFQDMMSGGSKVTQAVDSAVTKGSTMGFTAGVKAAAPEITAVIAAAVRNGFVGGSTGMVTSFPQLPPPGNAPLPLPGPTNSGKKGIFSGLGGKAGKFVKDTFGEDKDGLNAMRNLGLTVAGVSVAISGATKLIQGAFDSAIQTAGESLEELGELKPQIEGSISELEEKISGVASQKDIYEDNLSTARITGKGDSNYNEAIKSNNNLIRTIRSEFPKLATEFTKFEDGMWQVKEGFWDEYTKTLEDQKARLELMDSALAAQEAELIYRQSTDNQIKTTDISDDEAEKIDDNAAIGAAIGGVIAAALAVAFLPVTGIVLAGLTTATAAAGAGIGGFGAAKATEHDAKAGITQEQLDKSLEVIGEFGTLSQDSADEIINAIENDSIDNLSDKGLKNLVDDIGGGDDFQALYNAVDGNVDILNEAVVQYQNMKSAQEDYRMALIRSARKMNGESEKDDPRIDKYNELIANEKILEAIDRKAESNWKEISDQDKTKYIEEAARREGFKLKAGKWEDETGSTRTQDEMAATALSIYKMDQREKYVRQTSSAEGIDLIEDVIKQISSGKMTLETLTGPVFSDYTTRTDDQQAFLQKVGQILNLNPNDSVNADLMKDYVELLEETAKKIKEEESKFPSSSNASEFYSKTKNLSAAKTVKSLDDLGLSGAILEGLDSGKADQDKVVAALSRNITSMDDVQDMMGELKEAGIDVTESATEVAKQLGVKDLGTTLTSETVQAISDKLTSGTALSLQEANTVSRAMGKGGIYEGMSDQELYNAGFIQTEDGFKPLVSAQEAIQALNNRMASDLGAVRTILEEKYKPGDKGVYGEIDISNMDYGQAQAALAEASLVEQANLRFTQWDPIRDQILSDRRGGNYQVQSIDEFSGEAMSDEALKSWDQYLDTQLTVTNATARYNQVVKERNVQDEKELRQIKQEIVAEEQLKQKIVKLASAFSNLSDDLDSSDPTKYANALDKITSAVNSNLGLNLTSEQVEKLKGDFEALIAGGNGAKEAMANISAEAGRNTQFWKDLGKSEEEAKALAEQMSNANYQLIMTGSADFSFLNDAIASSGKAVSDVQGQLQALAGSSVQFKVVTKTVDDDSFLGRLFGWKKQVEKIVPVYTGGDLKSGGGSTGSGGGGSGGGSSVYKNEYDKRYNLVEDIAEEQRTLNKLEAEYQDLLEGSNTSAQKLLKNYDKQVSSLEKQQKLNQKLLTYRKKDMKSLLSQNSKYSQYATYNQKDNTIEINWDKINKIKSSDKGEKVDEYISKLEEAQSRIEEVEDTLLDIKQTIRELGEEQVDAYVSSLNQVKDALVEAQQQQIDKLSKLNDTINDQNSRMFDAIQKSIDDERQARENDKTEQDIADKERRLAQLQMDTTGGNQTEILALQKEIEDAREGYGDSLVDQQLARMQDEADQAAEQRERQISLMEEQLDLYQSTGEVWRDVYDLWATGFTSNGKLNMESPLGKLLMDTADYMAMSQEERNQTRNEWGELFGQGMVGQNLFLQNQDNLDMAKELEAIEKKKKSTQSGIDYSQMNDSMRSAYKNQVIAEGKKRVKSGKATKNEKAKWGNTKDEGTSNNKPTSKLNKSAKGKISSITSNVNEDTPWYRKSTENLQKGINALIADGFIDGIAKLETDGEFGPKTKKAVQALQRLIGVDDDGRWGPASRTAFSESKYKSYKTGGLADFTGPAWLDGTKAHPELVLNSRDTENFIQLKDILSNVLKRDNNKTENSGDNYFEIHIDVERIEDDYDVEQLADKIKGIIQQDAMYRNVNVINRLR